MTQRTKQQLLDTLAASFNDGGGATAAEFRAIMTDVFDSYLIKDNNPRPVSMGISDYNDTATATTPIAVPGNGSNVALTNDAAGPFTNEAYAIPGTPPIWDSVSQTFDWSFLALGDAVDVRLDIEVTTTTPNQNVAVDLVMAVGGSSYPIPYINQTFKSAGVHPLNRYNGVYMGDSNTLDNGANFVVRSDAPASVKVNGWYCKVLKVGS